VSIDPRWLEAILVRELDTLRREIEAFSDEADLWRPLPGVTNPAGTLALHLAGNLQHFLGATLGGTGYVRDREAEFASRGLSRAQLLAAVDGAIAAVRAGFAAAPDLDAPLPDAPGGFGVRTGDFLTHLVAHTAFHLGQLDYHRRVVTGRADSVRPMAIGALASAERRG
jgi:uncharacterized damage-inducible protein DinB